ncbi:MAG TPA: hypothetical protein VKH37_12775, partial [Ferruginibacter sp.]|nr:hypothetical protein [Ferruginibacter sp.]
CGVVLPSQTGAIMAAFPKAGEYNVSYELVMSQKALDFYMEYLKQAQVMKTEEEYKKDYLKKIDLSGCFNDCRDCRTKLGTLAEFIERMKKILHDDDNITITTDDIEWITQLYNVTLTKCGEAETVGQNCHIADACADQRKMMLKDLTPGGQYMMYDPATLAFMERDINVFVTKVKGNTAIAATVNIIREGQPATVPLNSLKEIEVITQWNPDWAYLMLPQHPEYCLLEECNNNNNMRNRNKDMMQLDDEVKASQSPYYWDRAEANYATFVNNDLGFIGSPYISSSIIPWVENRISHFIPDVPTVRSDGYHEHDNVTLREFIRFIVYCPDAQKPP